MKRFTTKMLCRAGIVAALYVVLTWPLGALAFGTLGFQIRPAEALTMLPLFYPEAVPALYVGCLIANIITGNAWDIGLGSLCSLIAALLTWGAGKLIKNTPLKLIAGGIFPAGIVAAVTFGFCRPRRVRGIGLFCFTVAAAGEQSGHHHGCQQQREQFLHVFASFRID